MTTCGLINGTFNPKCPIDKTGASDSIIVFAKKMINSKMKKVVFKITSKSDIKENALAFERDAYMYVKNVVSQDTPHFAQGIEIGTCAFSDIAKIDGFWKKVFIPKWKQARGLAIYLNVFGSLYKTEFKKRFKLEYKFLDELYKHDQEELAKIRLEKLYEFAYFVYCEQNPQVCEREKIHYVMTKKLKGESLFHFIDKNYNSSSYDLDIAIQVAQAFSAAKKHKFMHNDCHPGNIFIRKRTPQEIHDNPSLPDYHYPFKFSLKTDVIVTIFDYDFSSHPNLENTSLTNVYCDTSGTCNGYTENYDWYYFLHKFVETLSEFRKTVLSDYLDKNPKDYHYYGRACKCIKESDDKSLPKELTCILCKLDTQTLNAFITPEQFLEKQLLSNNSINFKQIHIKKLPPQPIVIQSGAKLVNPESVLQEFLRFTSGTESPASFLLVDEEKKVQATEDYESPGTYLKMHMQKNENNLNLKTQPKKHTMTLSQEAAYRDFMKKPDPIDYLDIIKKRQPPKESKHIKSHQTRLQQQKDARKKDALVR